jgi:hypothetical protein
MTTYLIEGARSIRIEADEISSRADGSLWVLRAVETARPAERKLATVLVLAKGQWTAVHCEEHADAVLFIETPLPATAEQRREPHVMPVPEPPPDTLRRGW